MSEAKLPASWSYGDPTWAPEKMLAEMRRHRALITEAIAEVFAAGRGPLDAAENVMGNLDLAGLTIVPKQA